MHDLTLYISIYEQLYNQLAISSAQCIKGKASMVDYQSLLFQWTIVNSINHRALLSNSQFYFSVKRNFSSFYCQYYKEAPKELVSGEANAMHVLPANRPTNGCIYNYSLVIGFQLSGYSDGSTHNLLLIPLSQLKIILEVKLNPHCSLYQFNVSLSSQVNSFIAPQRKSQIQLMKHDIHTKFINTQAK